MLNRNNNPRGNRVTIPPNGLRNEGSQPPLVLAGLQHSPARNPSWFDSAFIGAFQFLEGRGGPVGMTQFDIYTGPFNFVTYNPYPNAITQEVYRQNNMGIETPWTRRG